MEFKHGIMCGRSLNFSYPSGEKLSYVAINPVENYITLGWFDVDFDESRFLVKVRYPCGCCVEISADFYISQCEKRPPMLLRGDAYTCPHCGSIIN